MMVNQMSNNSTPWQSTGPNQMPWMSSCTVNNQAMQFGQTPISQTNIEQPPNTTKHVPAMGIPAQPLFVPSSQPVPTFNSATMLNPNPFDPQLFTHQQVTNSSTPISPTSQIFQPSHLSSTPLVQDSQFTISSLTQLPIVQQSSSFTHTNHDQTLQQKRSSSEMEDDIIAEAAPPTKQQLSEDKLFTRFGTLHLDNEELAKAAEVEELNSDSSDGSVNYVESRRDRKGLNRYVYLLFKDKKSNNLFDDVLSSAMDRLIRDEREKLSKAVILWSPPMKDSLIDSLNQDEDDDEEFKYKDYRDFLKDPNSDGGDGIIITEVVDDVPIEDADQTDEVMQD